MSHNYGAWSGQNLCAMRCSKDSVRSSYRAPAGGVGGGGGNSGSSRSEKMVCRWYEDTDRIWSTWLRAGPRREQKEFNLVKGIGREAIGTT